MHHSQEFFRDKVMTVPIMPKGTAVWLIENTALTFDQIAKFCGMHELEVQALADEQGASVIAAVNPIQLGQLTQSEIDRCTKDPAAELQLSSPLMPTKNKKAKRKYTPLIKRQDRPDAVAWLLKYYPEMSDAMIASLIAATKATVVSIRERLRSHVSDLRPRDPVLLGFCSQLDLDSAVNELKKISENQEVQH